jgi:hypothetical protein
MNPLTNMYSMITVLGMAMSTTAGVRSLIMMLLPLFMVTMVMVVSSSRSIIILNSTSITTTASMTMATMNIMSSRDIKSSRDITSSRDTTSIKSITNITSTTSMEASMEALPVHMILRHLPMILLINRLARILKPHQTPRPRTAMITGGHSTKSRSTSQRCPAGTLNGKISLSPSSKAQQHTANAHGSGNHRPPTRSPKR